MLDPHTVDGSDGLSPLVGRRRFVFVSDEEWRRIEPAIRDICAVRDEFCTRVHFNAALSVMVGNCNWTQLPEELFGGWKINYNRTGRWIDGGVWMELIRSGRLREDWVGRIHEYIELRNLRRVRRELRRLGR